MLTNAADDSMMVVEKLKQMNITPDAITTTIQFHWASALVRSFFVFLFLLFSSIGSVPWLVSFFYYLLSRFQYQTLMLISSQLSTKLSRQ